MTRPCRLFIAYEVRMGLFIDVSARGNTLEFLLPLFLPPPKYSLNLAKEPHRLCSSRIEPIVEDDHSDLSIGLHGGKTSSEVGSTEARDRSSSRPLATSVSKPTLGLEGSERGSIIHLQVYVELKAVTQFRRK